MPTVDSLSQSQLSGAESFTIAGQDFTGTVKVFVGETEATINTQSSTSLEVVCNDCCAGTHDVVVANDIGRSNAISIEINEAITSVTPSSVNAGESITIAGSAFCQQSVVQVGGVDCVVSSLESTQIVCTVSSSSGTHDVTVGSATLATGLTVSAATFICTIDGSYSPVYQDFVEVNCDSALTNY